MDDIVALCRRRGFIFQSSEIYGGINGFWDYGPLGTLLKRNLKNAWWEDMVERELTGPDGQPIDMVGVDTTIIMHPKVWEASGHVAGFNDPMVDCKACKARFRDDQVFVLLFRKNPLPADYEARLWERFGQINEACRDLVEKGFPADDVERHPSIQALIKAAIISDIAPEFLKAVVASNEAEAEVLGALTSRERRIFADVNPTMVTPLSTYRKLGRIVFPPPPCPNCNLPQLTEPRQFNLMFETYVGAIRDEENKSYLRPETAQGIFINFWNIVDTSRVKVPFGIAQQGKAFRNEVTPRNFTFRSREFEQMEIEFFIHPDSAKEWYAYWRDMRYQWWQSIGLTSSNLQLREHEKDELAHYAKEGAGTSDIEYKFPFTAPGFGELEGVAHRADFDLKAHANATGKGDKLKYFDQELQVKLQNEGKSKDEINERSRYFPHVIEPSAGADRGTLALICEAFTPTPERQGSAFVMKFHPRMAPIKAAVFPLVAKDGMPEVAEKLYKQLRKRWNVEFDVKQSIGKRYARMDEAGTPFCFTIDGETLTTQTVTVRHRDTAQQERIAIDKVEAFLEEKIGGGAR